MSGKSTKRVKEQVVVYMDEDDVQLLDDVVRKTGLSKTELFRRGLRQLAGSVLPERRPGSGFAYLIATAERDDFPADASERLDEYLYRSVSRTRRTKTTKRKRARVRR
jgi:hypothetical protein